jgi:pentatricopeptide repeat protein
MPTEARALFVQICDLGLRPSVATYTCLLQSYAERGQFEEAELILRDMVLSGDAKPNTITYTGSRSKAYSLSYFS